MKMSAEENISRFEDHILVDIVWRGDREPPFRGMLRWEHIGDGFEA